MSALASLGAAAVLLPGALIAERTGRRKWMVLLGGGGGSRLILLALALLPLVFRSGTLLHLAIILVVLRSAFIHLGVPAWTSLTADVVPLASRGRYFSSRYIAMGIAGMLTTYLVGQLISRVGAPEGYQLAIGIAFVIGVASTASFARIREPVTQKIPLEMQNGPSVSLVQRLRAHPDFLAFCGVAAVWNLSMGLAAPFFSVYMVENLNASASMVGALAVVSTLAALPGQRLFGSLTDRWGPRRVQLLTGIAIPLVPWTWALARAPQHLVPVELVAGFVWAGYNLASFSFLLTLTPEGNRGRYAAIYQLIVTLALAAGAGIGGIIATHWGLISVFILSGFGRLVAAVLFAGFVGQPGLGETRPSFYRRVRRHKVGAA